MKHLGRGCHDVHWVLGPFGTDSTLRRWGLGLAARGGGHAKKRAVVAVARKLAVLMHVLWVKQENYDPMHGLTETVSHKAGTMRRSQRQRFRMKQP